MEKLFETSKTRYQHGPSYDRSLDQMVSWYSKIRWHVTTHGEYVKYAPSISVFLLQGI